MTLCYVITSLVVTQKLYNRVLISNMIILYRNKNVTIVLGKGKYLFSFILKINIKYEHTYLHKY